MFSIFMHGLPAVVWCTMFYKYCLGYLLTMWVADTYHTHAVCFVNTSQSKLLHFLKDHNVDNYGTSFFIDSFGCTFLVVWMHKLQAIYIQTDWKVHPKQHKEFVNKYYVNNFSSWKTQIYNFIQSVCLWNHT